MKKLDARIMSDMKCIKCGKLLKQNLINKKPDALLCYYCHSIKRHNPEIGRLTRVGYKASGLKDDNSYVKTSGRFSAKKESKSK